MTWECLRPQQPGQRSERMDVLMVAMTGLGTDNSPGHGAAAGLSVLLSLG